MVLLYWMKRGVCLRCVAKFPDEEETLFRGAEEAYSICYAAIDDGDQNQYVVLKEK